MYYCVYCKRKPALAQKTQCIGTRIGLSLILCIIIKYDFICIFRKVTLRYVSGFRLLQMSFTTDLERIFVFVCNKLGGEFEFIIFKKLNGKFEFV